MQLNKFKKLLENQKEEIMLFIKNNQQAIDFDGDETDEIQAKILARSAEQLISIKQVRLNKINNALKRIGEGGFGQCEGCGEDISEKRLLIDPGFSNCVSCSEELDILKRRQNH